MDLKTALSNNAPKKQPCKLEKILQQLSTSDRTLWEKYASSPQMSPARLAKALTEAGYPISDDAVTRHLNYTKKAPKKNCCCKTMLEG